MKDPDLTPHEARLTRWIDDALTPEARREWEASLRDPAERERAEAERRSAESLRRLVREHGLGGAELPFPDFFNSQVSKRIRAAGALPAAAGPAWLEWLRRPWMPVAAAGCAAAAVLAYSHLRPGDSGTRVISVYSPEPNAVATAVMAEDAGAVIIDVQGLESFPSDRVVVGWRPEEPGALVASVTP
jgi:hypothetical protein